MARANGGRLDRPTGSLGMIHVLAHGEGEAATPKQDEPAREAGPQAATQSTPIASGPMERALRLCGCVASRCVATQRHSLSRLTEPLWVASAPQAHAALSAAPVLFGILRRKRARLATKSQTNLLAPGGEGGNTRRCDTRDHVISFLQTVRGDPVACAPSLKPRWTNMGCIQPRHSGLDAPCWALRNFVPTSMFLWGGQMPRRDCRSRRSPSQNVNPAAS